MELRKPLILTIVAAAGGAAVARAWPGSAPPPSAVPFATASQSATVAAPAFKSHAFTMVAGEHSVGAGFAATQSALRPNRPLREPANAGGHAVVYVAGEVAHPGVYALSTTARGADAVHVAGGPTRAADLVAVNLAAPLEDGAEIIVPAKGSAAADEAVSAVQTAHEASPRSRRRRSTHRRKHRVRYAGQAVDYALTDGPEVAAPLVPLNTADVSALEALPGIGHALATRIVAFRDVNGPFASLDELLDVSGITQAKLDALTPSLRLR